MSPCCSFIIRFTACSCCLCVSAGIAAASCGCCSVTASGFIALAGYISRSCSVIHRLMRPWLWLSNVTIDIASAILNLAICHALQLFSVQHKLTAYRIDIIVSLHRLTEQAQPVNSLPDKLRLLGRICKIIAVFQHINHKQEGIACVLDTALVALRTLCLNKLIRVLELSCIKYFNVKPCLIEYRKCLELGIDACLIAVLREDDIIRVSLKQTCMLVSKCRAKAGNCIGKACLMQRNDIHVALAEQQVLLP